MKQYFKTEIVQAEPARRYWMEDGLKIVVADSEEVPEDVKNAVACESGYRVLGEDGCMSWVHKEIFEMTHHETAGMSFGAAIEAAKKGMRIARAGWNGKNQYVELGCDFTYTAPGDIPVRSVQHLDIGSQALVFVGTRGRQVGWLASQSDMLADDWMIVE